MVEATALETLVARSGTVAEVVATDTVQMAAANSALAMAAVEASCKDLLSLRKQLFGQRRFYFLSFCRSNPRTHTLN